MQQDTDGDASEFARAKVNLALHITGRREDGYHLLDSLVVFPEIGDRLRLLPGAPPLSLTLGGFFGPQLSQARPDNLVLRAIEALAGACCQPPLRAGLLLEKNLPVASGIGGGSADAAAALRLAARMTGVDLPQAEWLALALSLGADVPVCLEQKAVRMSGIGEKLHPAPPLPPAGIVLVNPLKEVSTPAIFRALTQRDNPPLPALPSSFGSCGELAEWLKSCRNDMQEAAEALCPEITEVLAALGEAKGSLLARMSGSGATCFALCAPQDAASIAAGIEKSHPEWWVASSGKIR
ncbi:4-(cytidine 5'-diphospho)-2-C-methyl-D-erythritol kinase [Roseibium litorale]|uniref:4-diphosphocytidyl-2-C-methyl-D-erythritol kinase n=1 Tax=Roseibium litorale TaxID=2803841 RepID=A0ABR9CHV1_9HYPH|nr:4-(cytidine 5'-diphospho)-2-C-methyl-D-erythritol kinase [Roseibium litorale]MBD8890313.1 4-(cytidine 5'-diphospho)-2-C-methyl-D-erythritol kinase [Roseibium litorale]